MKLSKITQLTMSLILTASLILGLVMIPGSSSYAASYSMSDFVYQYNGYNYAFFVASDFPVSSDLPENYTFDSSVLDEVISYTGKGLNLNFASYQGYFFTYDMSQSIGNQIFAFVQNAIVAIGNARQDLGVTSATSYAWDFKYTGSDSNYPGHDLYGTAYGFRFSGLTWETIDLVLDSSGHLYGSQVLGNFSSSETTEDVFQWSIHQHDSDDIWLVPEVRNFTFNDLDTPYIMGKDLYFTVYNNNNAKFRFRVNNFVNTYISVGAQDFESYSVFRFYSPDATSQSYYTLTNLDNMPIRETGYMTQGSYRNILYFSTYQNTSVKAFNLPNNWQSYYGNTWNFNSIVNSPGYFNSQHVSQSVPRIYLGRVTLTPDPDPPTLPVGDPINLVDIPTDPTIYVPTEDPEPVPGVDYPVPEPEPVPVPPLPPLVSGNDDLWPDLNDVFTIEADLDGFLGGLSNFEFTPLRTLVEGFTSALTWVSTIMMLLYDGSDFSILFVVLSIFFIASALLGIYKWWSSR